MQSFTSSCLTCSDHAEPAQVLKLLPEGMAAVDLGGIVTEISLELVDAAPGDIVLVHAGVAIGPTRAVEVTHA